MAGDIHHEPRRHQDCLVKTTPSTSPGRIGRIIPGPNSQVTVPQHDVVQGNGRKPRKNRFWLM